MWLFMRAAGALCAGILLTLHAAAQEGVKDRSKLTRPFTVADAEGSSADVAQMRGKVVFINFWSLTCVPCKAEMPGINNMRLHYMADTGLVVMPVDLDRNIKDDTAYMRKKGMTLPVYVATGVVPQELFQGELPTTVVLDRQGNIVFHKEGRDAYDVPSFYHLIDSLLQQ